MFFRSKYKSPNFNERKTEANPSLIILHYTGMETAKAALERLCDPSSEVSAHYVIEENGKTHQLVDDDMRAWHAGKSHWAGETDINSMSIGIEIVNKGHEWGYEEFPEKQIIAVAKLCNDLIKKYKIPPSNILAHSDISPNRKLDPGHLFPWEVLATKGVGLWPVPTEMDYQAAEDLILNKDAVHELLCAFGYDPSCDLEDVIVAYHRHFHPEKFNHWDDRPIEPDVLSCARLLALIRAQHEQNPL